MWCEVTIAWSGTLTSDLPEVLAAYFGASADANAALAMTIWRDHPVPPQDPVLAKIDPDRVLVVRQFDASTLKLHIETPLNPNDIRWIKQTASEYTTSMLGFLKRHKLGCKKLEVHIYDAGANALATGHLHRRRDVVTSTVKEKWWVGIAIPVLTLLTRLVFAQDLKDATVNAAAAFGATVLFTILHALLHEPRVQYDQ